MTDAMSPQELLARLRADILAAADDTDDVEEAQIWADEHLDGLTASLVSDGARGLVDSMLWATVDDLGFPAPPETRERRERLLDALDRGLSANARRDVLLQPLLAEARVAAGVSRQQVASDLGFAENEFADLENGTKPLSREDPANIARWIRRLDVAEDEATSALGRSLDQAAGGDYALAAGGTARVGGDNDAFIKAVRDQLAAIPPLGP